MSILAKQLISSSETTVSDAQIVYALGKLLESDVFQGSSRMREFLRYVVEEYREGRADQIRAKTIAMDVYGYPAAELERREAVVRVDAGRVRHKLAEYYEGEGSGDDLVISLPTGGYAPLIRSRPREVVEPAVAVKGQHRAAFQRWQIAIGGSLALVAVVLLLLAPQVPDWGVATAEQQAVPTSGDSVQRELIFETSPVRLRAMDLAEVGRDLIWPAADIEQVGIAEQVFSAVIKMDETFHGGYAGLAQVLALKANLLREDPARSPQIEQARLAVQQATLLQPEDPWTHSALAMVSFAEKDFESARIHSERALVLAPRDQNIIAFDALISFFRGDFTRVMSVVGNFESDKSKASTTVLSNIFASTKFHLGDYIGSIDVWKSNIQRGAPAGPVAVAYLMAAHAKLGQFREARGYAEAYERSWSAFPIDEVFRASFVDSAFADDLDEAMRRAGWSP